MIALLGREFVNLPLLCGVAGRSRDSSGPPTRGTFGFTLTAGIFHSFSLGWFTVCQGAASICVCPFFNPHWVSSLCFLRSTAVSSYPLPSLSLSLHLSDQCPGTLHLGQSLSGPLLTACFQKRVLGPGVVWWHSPGTPPPSHCPPHLWRRSEQVHWRGLWRCQLEGCRSWAACEVYHPSSKTKRDEFWSLLHLTPNYSASELPSSSLSPGVQELASWPFQPAPETRRALGGRDEAALRQNSSMGRFHSWHPLETCQVPMGTRGNTWAELPVCLHV